MQGLDGDCVKAEFDNAIIKVWTRADAGFD